MISFSEYFIGQKASLSKTFSAKEIIEFSRLTGDSNPIHLDESFSINTPFKKCIVHGTFYTAIIGTILGTKLPGFGSILVSQEHKFIKPVFVGDTVTANLEITNINIERQLITLSISCINQNNQEVLTGLATVKKIT